MPDKEPKFSEEELEKNKVETTPEQETVTIMPTMIDDSEIVLEKKRDLSAIIPKSTVSAAEDAIALDSKDNQLKGDGSISIGTMGEDGEATANTNAALPAQIDIAERKKIADKNKGVFKKEKEKKNKKTAQKVQNTTALISLILIIGLAGFFYWFKNHKTDKDFVPINIYVELGDPLPIRGTSYVKPGVGSEVDELKYAIDTKEVRVETVGEYPFTVTYKGITKTGTITVGDKTPPDLKVKKEYTIKEGDNYDASKFVIDCIDYSGCNYSFQIEGESKYEFPGSYVVHVTATDAYQNTTTQVATLIIESTGTVKKYEKYINFSFSTGYSKTERYEITFMDYDSYSAILRGTYTEIFEYEDEDKFKEAAKLYSSEADYMIDEARKEITHKVKITSVGSNYTRLDDVEAYLQKEQFRAY